VHGAGSPRLAALDHDAAADGDGVAFDERARDHLARGIQHAREGGPRDAHAARGLLLVQPLAVREAQRLQTVEGEDQGLEPAQGYALGLEDPRLERAAYVAGEHGTRHAITFVKII